jgi:7-keto-8-aminopelargonate synthetase-like enzyme
VLVIVEGLYSMDGDVPDLPLLLELAKQYNFWTMIDEAHSIGVLGRTGRGICEHFGVPAGEVDLIVGTLSKSLAACGGFICAREPVIEWLRYSLPGYVYSVGIPPPTAAAVCTALALISRESERVARLHATSAYFISTARRLGFDVGKAIGIGVVPIIFKDTEAAFLASEALLASGIYAPPIVQLGIPKDMPRLRFFLSASHTTADIDRVFDVLSAWRELPGETGLRSSPLESQIRGLALAETELDTFPAQPHAHR